MYNIRTGQISKNMVYTEFDRLGTGSDANCKKGMPCGNSCISKSKKCREGLGTAVSAVVDHVTDPPNLEQGAGSNEASEVQKTDKDVDPLLQSLLDDGKKNALKGGAKAASFVDEKEVNGNIMNIGTLDVGKVLGVDEPPKVAAIDIKINEEYDKGQNISPRDSLKLALAAKSSMLEQAKYMPDGSVLYNSPYDKDGFADKRASLYEKAGFSPPNKDGGMFSIVLDGKMRPVTKEQIIDLKERGLYGKQKTYNF